jgi:hypothetical protein
MDARRWCLVTLSLINFFRKKTWLAAYRTFVEEQFIAFENIQPYNIRELIGEVPK